MKVIWVFSVLKPSDDQVHLGCKVYQGDVAVGDTLNNGGYADGPNQLSELVVQEIDCYGKSVRELYEGYHGTLKCNVKSEGDLHFPLYLIA